MASSLEISDIAIKIAPIVISFLAYLNARKSKSIAKKSSDIAEKSLKLAERNERKLRIEDLQALPSLDFVDVIDVGEKKRVKLRVTNMRSTPCKINCVEVFKSLRYGRNFVDFKEKCSADKLDDSYELVENVVWNPKGNLDDSEYFMREAGEFQIIHNSELILVSIPSFDERQAYLIRIFTSHGNICLEGRLSISGKVLFTTGFKQEFT
ncbi:TPA: hypothetical protein NKP90_004661 [Vibrio parahaemolyticus]|nr:hypothetical protein [Vibrio parahaemolyticus]